MAQATNEGFAADIGNGGETHQHVPVKGDHEAETHLTTNQGIRVSDNQNQLKAGARGPVLLEDFALREKIFHFDHERIPERIVHARGSAAHGFFEVYESLADITKADLFQRPGERTPVFTRFSTGAGRQGLRRGGRETLLGPRAEAAHAGLISPPARSPPPGRGRRRSPSNR